MDSNNSNDVSNEKKLSDELRNKYIKKLSNEGSTWVFGIALIIIYSILSSITSSDIAAWIEALLIIAGIAIASVIKNVYKESRERKISTDSDDVIEHDYKALSNKKMFVKITGLALVVLVIGAIAVNKDLRQSLVSKMSSLSNDAKCEVISYTVKESSFVVKNQADYGYIVSGKIINTGETGKVDVIAGLNSSEGKLTREQSLSIKKGEVLNVSYKFHEPTLNATNVQYNLNCR